LLNEITEFSGDKELVKPGELLQNSR